MRPSCEACQIFACPCVYGMRNISRGYATKAEDVYQMLCLRNVDQRQTCLKHFSKGWMGWRSDFGMTETRAKRIHRLPMSKKPSWRLFETQVALKKHRVSLKIAKVTLRRHLRRRSFLPPDERKAVPNRRRVVAHRFFPVTNTRLYCWTHISPGYMANHITSSMKLLPARRLF